MQQDYKSELRAMTDGLDEWCRQRRRRSRRRTAALNLGLLVLAAVGALQIVQLPAPDGLYVSDLSNRSAVLANANMILTYATL